MQTCQLLSDQVHTPLLCQDSFNSILHQQNAFLWMWLIPRKLRFWQRVLFHLHPQPRGKLLSQKSQVRVFAWGRDISVLPDVAIPATLCSAGTSCESVSTGFAFGNFCWVLLPYLLQYYWILLRAFSSEFYSMATMPLCDILREFATCPKMLVNSSLPEKPEVCWSQLSFLTSSYNILVMYLLEGVVFHQQSNIFLLK